MARTKASLSAIAIGRFRGELEFAVRLVQQVLGFLCMACQIPFIGLLRFNDFVVSSLAEALRSGQIRMPAGRNVPCGWLSDGESADEQECAKNGCEE
jgi:hypothetical protein